MGCAVYHIGLGNDALSKRPFWDTWHGDASACTRFILSGSDPSVGHPLCILESIGSRPLLFLKGLSAYILLAECFWIPLLEIAGEGRTLVGESDQEAGRNVMKLAFGGCTPLTISNLILLILASGVSVEGVNERKVQLDYTGLKAI